MRCAWKELLSILPTWMRNEVDRLGREALQELRLRLGQTPELIRNGDALGLDRPVTPEDLSYIVSAASRYSPWAAASMASGYLTAPGGHRIGLCGEAVVQNGNMTGLRRITSLCVRVARDFPGIAAGLDGRYGSVLILGPPGSGKTTLLRDLVRLRGEQGSVGVVDERCELFPAGFALGCRTDVLTNCSKEQGLDALIRTMTPQTVAVDEITREGDCQALIRAGWCGVRLLATAHGTSRKDLESRPVYKTLLDSGLFDTLVILHADKSWKAERMKP